MLKAKTNAIILVLSSIAIVGAFIVNSFFSVSLSKIATQAGNNLEYKLKECNAVLDTLLSVRAPGSNSSLYDAFDKKNIGVYLFKNDSLVFWNNSQLPVEEGLKAFQKNEGLLKLKHGYYLCSKIRKDNVTAYAVCLIKPIYDLQNNYLKNEFLNWTEIPGEIELLEKTSGDADVNLKNEKLFGLKGNEEHYFKPAVNLSCAYVFLTGFIALLISLMVFFKRNNSYRNLALVLLPIVILKVIIYLKPALLSGTFLYNLRLFANAGSVMNNSLADVLFNSTALLYISLLFHLKFSVFNNWRERILQFVMLFILAFFIIWQFNHSLKSLVINSTLSFDFLSVFNIRIAAAVGLLSLVFNSLALFVTLYRTCSFFDKSLLIDFIKYISTALALCLCLHFIAPMDSFLQDLWPLLFAAVLYVLVKLRYQRFSLGMGILILVMSAITSGFFNYYIDKDEKQHLEVLAYNLSERQDPLLESEFAGLPQRIHNDTKLGVLLNFLPGSEKEIASLLKQKYFSGYFNRYNIEFSMFDKDCRPLLTPGQAILLNEGFFEDQIKFNSDSTFSPELFFVKAYKKNSRYIGKIGLADKNLYVLLEPKQFEELGTFPDLLLDQSPQQKQENLKNSSYAVYRSDQNTNRYGEFNYPFYFRDSTALAGQDKEYIHHYFSPDESTRIIISKKVKDWNYRFTYNSYLFLFFSIVSFLCYYVYATLFTTNFNNASLTRRIQTIVIVLLLLAMSAVGITSGNLVSKQFETDNIKQLQEKTQTIENELAVMFKPEELFDVNQKELVNLKLKELTHLFNTDISLFDQHGTLFNTSQPRLYEKGLAAGVANPKAYFNLKENKASAYSYNEKAGTLQYLSLYTPVYSSNKTLLGFVNLPYFAKQSDLVNELSGIISALINVYVILFVISILAGLILAGYITKPLRLIKQQISNITLGKQNETINWSSNDEVGKLVNEYNNMLLKLEHSATLLAQSERESAWREMAKQVAHEIKNPLTPMKLNLQYLQHVMKNNPEGFNEKFETASRSIIEQIDTLAGIANEFSNFAKLPGTNLQSVNLTEVINSTVNLFDKKRASVIHTNLPAEEIFVLGDKEQALRVFNNIIKNAMQAIEGVEEPWISITARFEDDLYKVSIEDNGCGIAEAMREKIFEPNFTTKSTGSGLGLAMVKNIMSGFGGCIYFESKENKGTTFYMEFRKGN
ncbi:MAG: HAMP domain-containing histidine kinase [Bacteroidetes bacterium]|nr:HAMP domain-containing histidine kinase [Bacteroidota bacterium]